MCTYIVAFKMHLSYTNVVFDCITNVRYYHYFGFCIHGHTANLIVLKFFQQNALATSRNSKPRYSTNRIIPWNKYYSMRCLNLGNTQTVQNQTTTGKRVSIYPIWSRSNINNVMFHRYYHCLRCDGTINGIVKFDSVVIGLRNRGNSNKCSTWMNMRFTYLKQYE